MADAASAAPTPPHIPVLLEPLLAALAPISGRWLDGTFGAGGYSRALLAAGASHVTAIDRDPTVFDLAASWARDVADRLTLIEGEFANLDAYANDLDGIVLDLGVSSMQLDQADRGFSFRSDGPLDMRMSRSGPTAGDLVNLLSEGEIADVLYLFGEEKASRRIARAIVAARPLHSTGGLADVIASCLPRAKPGRAHPATRSFQALRISVNGEFQQLADGLMAAERALKPGGCLAVVTFHSIEDRMVKRFFQLRASAGGQGNRFAPAEAATQPGFEIRTRRAIEPSDAELNANPRARSAKLRIAVRTDAPPQPVDPADLGMPNLQGKGRRR